MIYLLIFPKDKLNIQYQHQYKDFVNRQLQELENCLKWKNPNHNRCVFTCRGRVYAVHRGMASSLLYPLMNSTWWSKLYWVSNMTAGRPNGRWVLSAETNTHSGFSDTNVPEQHWGVRETYCSCRVHLVRDWRIQWSPPLCSVTETQTTRRHFGLMFSPDGWNRSVVTSQSQLTSSSQLQPRSCDTVTSVSDASDGGVTSSGMLGWCGGSLSMSFRLPCVPLFGAGFRPNKSDTDKQKRRVSWLGALFKHHIWFFFW